MSKLILNAKASNRKISLNVTNEDLELTLLEYLRKQNFPVASSCDGEGVCKKCIINGDVLSCKIKVSEMIAQKLEINVDYL